MSELLHTFRALYQKREFHKLHSLLLVGVSTVAELVVSSASPFNIVDQLELPYFTFDEVQALIHQHVSEAGKHSRRRWSKRSTTTRGGSPVWFQRSVNIWWKKWYPTRRNR